MFEKLCWLGWLGFDFFSLYSVVNKVDRVVWVRALLCHCSVFVLVFWLGFSLLLSFGHGECFVIFVMFELGLSGLAGILFF